MAFRDSAGGIANYKTPGKEVKMNGSTGMKKGGKVKESMMEKLLRWAKLLLPSQDGFCFNAEGC
jgi:hypothetical protein